MTNFILIFVFYRHCIATCKMVPQSRLYCIKQDCYLRLPSCFGFVLHPKINWSPELLYPIGVAWIGFIVSYLFFSVLGKRLGWSKN
jgi:hypothetical protein